LSGSSFEPNFVGAAKGTTAQAIKSMIVVILQLKSNILGIKQKSGCPVGLMDLFMVLLPIYHSADSFNI
jgi:hypothetical protein